MQDTVHVFRPQQHVTYRVESPVAGVRVANGVVTFASTGWAQRSTEVLLIAVDWRQHADTLRYHVVEFRSPVNDPWGGLAARHR